MAELTAIGVYVQFWWPEIPLWASSLFFFVVINTINLASVKVYGETEFWFSIIKVAAIIAMILFGGYLLISGTGGERATVANLYNDGGFFPKGWLTSAEGVGYQGLLAALVIIMFSFGGLELVGITAAEAENPEKNIPRATNQVLIRILIFYVGALFILFALMPWRDITADTSPFVEVFNTLNSYQFTLFGKTLYVTGIIANVLNVIVLTAALSVYNSCVYSNSRMLYGLAEQGNAPRFLKKLNKNHAPIAALLVSAALVFVCVVINWIVPEQALEILMSLVVSSLIINWIMISWTHLHFKKHKRLEQRKTAFPSLFYPLTNYICLLFLLGVLIMMWFTGLKISVELIPIWLILLWISYKLVQVRKKRNTE
jgi:aromatic amino acid transport protein AroP